ncbi:flagellar C1a complex subunit C1a-32-domain-containing protein [Pelagophyceae sp. CCMP2097]|nr:flagellar C1a complex subunit C1a-32-domain-containing protein [Pelagophyceae sp. CCMP2097]
MNSVAFQTVTREHIDELGAIYEPAKTRAFLLEVLQGKEGFDSKQLEIIADLYNYSWAFCKERGFDARKASTFLTICRNVFDFDISTNDPAKDMASSFKLFQTALLMHAVERPPKTVGVFDEGDVKAAVDFMLHNYYRHWRLYKVVFTKRLQVTITTVAPFGVNEPPPKAKPLAEAIQSPEEPVTDPSADAEALEAA